VHYDAPLMRIPRQKRFGEPGVRLRAFAAVCLVIALLTGCGTTRPKRVHYQIEPQYAIDDPQFLRSIGQLLGPEISPGNQVTALQNGDEIFPAMLAAIRSAQKSICLETYIYWSGVIGQEFSEALCERARAGVKVHVLIDWMGARNLENVLLEQMRTAGVEVLKYNPLVPYNLLRLNHRDHRKLLIVDGQTGFTGGAGIADIWLGNADSPQRWRDAMFRLEGPAVGQMQAAFMDNWIKTSARVLHGEAYFPELRPAGDQKVQVFTSSPRNGAENVRLMYLLSIAAARKNIRLAVPYFVPSDLTLDSLVRARRRGVEIEIIVPGARTDAPPVRHASRAKWGKLLRAGVRIYEYQPTMYHCKFMVVDDLWVTVGSANYDNRSFRLNDECNMNVYSARFARELVAMFDADKKKAHQASYEEWRTRSLYKRTMEVLTAPFRSFL
jgi:cardiolipin synthase